MRNGVIADFEAVEKMLAYFVRKAKGRSYSRPRLIICVPPASTPVERRAVKESAKRLKVREVRLIDEPMAAALGAGLPVTEPTGNMKPPQDARARRSTRSGGCENQNAADQSSPDCAS